VKIRLLVGLGNPEERYSDTRHNLGAQFVERVVPEAKFLFEKKCLAYCYRHGHVLLARPSVSMNLSGQTLAAMVHYYRIEISEILIAHDELDLGGGIARFKYGGGAGGHNGIADIARALGSHDFYRLRIGIGHPGKQSKVNSFVLSKPVKTERDQYEYAIGRALEALPLALAGSWEAAMTLLHTVAPEEVTQ
jgi:PTH1 family peptidyl-tRNA hydrolase